MARDATCEGKSDIVRRGGVRLGDRLDEDKLETLRAWGSGLSSDARDEVRAAGKAILLLIEEIDHLHVDIWKARAGAEVERSGMEGELEPPPAEPAEAERSGFDSALRWRLAGFRHRRSPAD